MTVPTTRATTVYGYLNAIKKLVLEEPKRLNMAVVMVRGLGLERYRKERLHIVTPDCGSVGCVAGWGLALAGRTDATNTYNIATMGAAALLFGLNQHQADELFMPNDLIFDKDRQTLAHAQRTVEHITAFQAKYAKQLKATKIERAK